MTNSIEKFDLNGFEKILCENNLVLVDFFASWCGPCKMFAPIVEQLSKKYESSVKTIKLDIDFNQDIADKYSIQSVPTLILFKNGTVAERNSGVISFNQCTNMIEKHLK